MATASTNELDLFFDNNPNRPSIDNLSISENSITSNKYLSGVRFYSIGDVFNISLSSSNIYDNTYTQNQIIVNLNQFAANNLVLNHNSSGVSGPSDPPAIGDSFNYSSTFTVNNQNIFSDDAIAEAYAEDPFGAGSSIYSSSGKYLILTYNNQSTNTLELFLDETYRLPNDSYDNLISNITNQWNSNNILSNGNLQVWPGLLTYPQIDYTSGYSPAQTANYSSFSGEQIYLRAFKSDNPHTNIILQFEGWNVSEWPYSNIELEIKLPTQTGWLRGDLPFNSADFTGSDGDGCFVANRSDNNEFYFTFGTFSTANSNFIVVIRIKYKNNSSIKEISKIEALNW